MKKIILTAAAVFAFGLANAQENAIKANPLAILGGTDLVSFEHKLSDNSSAVLGAGISSLSFAGAKYTSTGAELQYRYYFDQVMSGWYSGAIAGFTSGKVTEPSFFNSPETETKFSSIKVGAKGGYQWTWNSGFVLDLNLGFAYSKFNYSDTGYSQDFKASGVFPTFGLGLGYSF